MNFSMWRWKEQFAFVFFPNIVVYFRGFFPYSDGVGSGGDTERYSVLLFSFSGVLTVYFLYYRKLGPSLRTFCIIIIRSKRNKAL